MISLSPSKRAVTGIGARGGSRTGHRSGFGSRGSLAPKTNSSSTKCYTNKEHRDMTKPRSPCPGLFDLGPLDTQTATSDDDVEIEVGYETTSSPLNHSSSPVRQQDFVPATSVASKTPRPRIQTPGVAQETSPLNISPSDSRHHVVHQDADKNWVAVQQALSQQNPGPPSGKMSFTKRLSGILDKSSKKLTNESSSSANDDLYIAAAADVTYKGFSPTAYTHGNSTLNAIARRKRDLEFRPSASHSSDSPDRSEFSETLSACEDLEAEVDDNRYFSIHRQLTEGFSQRPPQSSAASTKSAATTESTASTNSSSTATSSISSTRFYLVSNGKHLNNHSDEEPSDEDDTGPSKQLEEPALRFACPFRMHDPQKFNNGSCAFSSWESISRLKEHLYRRHMYVCLRCRHAFKNQKELASHTVQAKACEPGIGVTEGITPDIERKIKSRKKASGDKSEKGSWEAIYQLLFPGEDIPWPYFRTPRHESLGSLDSRALADVEEKLRRELPSLVRNSEDILNLGEDALGRLISNINARIGQVFAPYGIGGGPLETASNAPTAQLPAQCQQDKSFTLGSQVLPHPQQANHGIAYQILPHQRLPNDIPGQGTSQFSMNIEESSGNNYLERFDGSDSMACSYQNPCYYLGGVTPYPSNPAISKEPFPVVNSPGSTIERTYNHNYDHNISQDPNNIHTLHTKISEATPTELLAPWDQPEPLDIGSFMDGVSFNAEMNFVEASGFNENDHGGRADHHWSD